MFKTLHNVGAERGATIKLTAHGAPRPIRMIERWDKLQKQGLSEGYTRFDHYALDKPMVFKDASGNGVSDTIQYKMAIKGVSETKLITVPDAESYQIIWE